VVASTVLAGAAAGTVAALVAAALTWARLHGEVPSGTALVVAVAVGGVTLALFVAALLELQDRERTRRSWLDRLSQLSEERSAAATAGARLATGAAAARRASGPAAVTIRLPHPAAGAAAEHVEPPPGAITVTSSAPPHLSLLVATSTPPPPALAAEHEA